MVTGRYSSSLVTEFDVLVETRSANVFQIFEEIAALEGSPIARGASHTKRAMPFNGSWLNGLWHKHYPQARFIPKNVMNYWRKPGRFQSLVQKAANEAQTQGQFIKRLYYDVVMGGYLGRSDNAELTGEWVVFAKQDGINYYLTLGAHQEDDEVIWRRCKMCETEFPELRILQENRCG